ncbi:four-carbon acid sugar kinase family protein [Kiloniella majae]|uniref:four-carbon acid sugar kinase family protein n=1 Tax=Kiloniella majae TaxID=1938558 RepID=UPI000A277A25|nr:four-carbon acid sugar kinase family protein [Kiloniella majae]
MKNINLKCPTIFVVADDLTSAADGAAPFLGRGLDITVRRWDLDISVKLSADVMSIDCGSRSMNEKEATFVVGQAVKRAPDSAILLKTIDSTLRGNIKAELKAAFDVSGRKRIVIAPAFPMAGRTTQKDVQLIDGIPVSETSYANDPVHPARTSRISDLIPDGIETVNILNAKTQRELNEQVVAFDHPEEILWVGSPGVAIALATALFGKKVSKPPIPYVGSSLVVVGSANSVSRAQAQRTQDKAYITCLMVPEKRVKDANTILSALTSHAADLAQSGQYGAVIATGGDTMDALLKVLDIDEFSLVSEFEPGFPLGIAQLPNGNSIIIAMKAGGFGIEETLLRAAERLQLSSVELSKVI